MRPSETCWARRPSSRRTGHLSRTLPYTRIATGAKFQTIPDNLRWKFRYNVYANDTDRGYDNPLITFVRSTPALAGKKITLSFLPATQTDQATISSFPAAACRRYANFA